MIVLIGHAFLFRLLFRNKVLLIPNPGPSSDVEEDHHQHHEYQEDNAPDYRVALQSSINDPEEEANHEAQHSADRQDHEKQVEESFTRLEWVVLFGYSLEFGSIASHRADVLILPEIFSTLVRLI